MSLTIQVQKDEDDFLEPDLYSNAKFSANQAAKRKVMKIRQNSMTGLKLKRSLVGEINLFEFQTNLLRQRELEKEELTQAKPKPKKNNRLCDLKQSKIADSSIVAKNSLDSNVS
jgi:hypothetical protein